MRLSIRHTTRYRFTAPVAHGLQRLRLIPKETQGQQIVDWSMEYTGAQEQLRYEDQNCNTVTLISVTEGTREVVVTCTGEVVAQDNGGVIGHHSGHLPVWAFLGHTPLTKPGAKVRQLVAQAGRGTDGATLDRLHLLSASIRDQVEYAAGTSLVTTTAEEAMAARQGVCQDHAHIFIAAARMMDVPARYVSGYMLVDGAVQQAATHAWAEALVPDLGWVGFDVSNAICPDARYVRVATGRDYQDAAPVTGISFGAQTEDMTVELAVTQQFADQ